MWIDPEELTYGVEEEYQIVDARTGELRSRAQAVLAADWTGDLKPEMQTNTVEVGTRVCRSHAELRQEVQRLRLQAAVAAESDGCRVVASGTHPFSHWTGQEYTANPVYHRIRDEYRTLADQQIIFGLHVHVGVPAGVDRARVMNTVRCYLAHALAVTGSSPYYLGEDTGYTSYRSLLWRRWPRTGPPPRFEDEAEFRRLVELLMATGQMDAPGRLYWELRPHHVYPTLEFRVADVTPRLDDVLFVAALLRALVAGAVQGVIAEPALPESITRTLLVENGWRASRDGLAAALVELGPGEPRPVPVAETLAALCERLAEVSEQLGDAEALALLPELLERGGAADRIRRRLAESEGDLPELVRWLADETVLGIGMDRRTEQRETVERA